MKGKPDLRVPTDKGRKNYEEINWKQYCPGCNKVLCYCKIKRKRRENEKI